MDDDSGRTAAAVGAAGERREPELRREVLRLAGETTEDCYLRTHPRAFG
jgi:hypothetical protein